MKIATNVDEIWKFFHKKLPELKSKMICIAEDEENEVEIYLTEEYGHPLFMVYIENVLESEEIAYSKLACQEVYTDILKSYSRVESHSDDDDGVELSTEDLERCDEITDATYDYLMVLCEASPENFGLDLHDLEVIANRVEEFLAEEYKLLIRHPTLIEEESGAKSIFQYPFGDASDNNGE